MNKPTFWSKVKACIKGGEEKNVNRFESAVFSKLNKEIKDRQSQIEDQKERLEDVKEILNDEVFNINMEQIKGIDAAKSYANTYLNNLERKQNIVDEIQEKIDVLVAEIEALEGRKTLIENAIPKDTE